MERYYIPYAAVDFSGCRGVDYEVIQRDQDITFLLDEACAYTQPQPGIFSPPGPWAIIRVYMDDSTGQWYVTVAIPDS